MAYLIAKALLPVYLGLALGYFAGRNRLIDNIDIRSLTSLLMQFALPLSLFMAIGVTPRAEIIQEGRFAAVVVLTLVLAFALMLPVSRHMFRTDEGVAAVHALTVGFPNIAGVGLSVLVSAFGPSAALPVAIGVTAGAVTISPLTLALLEIAKAQGAGGAGGSLSAFWPALGKSLRRPVFLGPTLGLVVSLLGISPPPLLAASLAPITTCTAGVGLFLTGLVLSAQTIRPSGAVLLSTLVKNILQPLLAFGLALLFGLSRMQQAEAVVLAALPCGFFGLVFGAGFGVRPPLSGSTLVVSSVLSSVTLSVALYLLL
jgi:malonate transporter